MSERQRMKGLKGKLKEFVAADDGPQLPIVDRLWTANGRLGDVDAAEAGAQARRALDTALEAATDVAKDVVPAAALAASVALHSLPTTAAAQDTLVAPIHRTQDAKLSAGQMALDSLIGDIARTNSELVAQPETISQQDIACLAKNAYHEARGEQFEGQLATILVVLARSRDTRKRFPRDICGVVYQPYQFSWTHDLSVLRAQKESSIDPIFKKLDAMLRDMRIDEAISLLSFVLKLPEGTLYYKRTDWNENNPEEKRMSDRSKKMWQSLKPARTIGNHTFYTD